MREPPFLKLHDIRICFATPKHPDLSDIAEELVEFQLEHASHKVRTIRRHLPRAEVADDLRPSVVWRFAAVSYTYLRVHETGSNLVCRLLL